MGKKARNTSRAARKALEQVTDDPLERLQAGLCTRCGRDRGRNEMWCSTCIAHHR